MLKRGTLLVVLMLAAGLAAAIGAIWHQYRQTREPLKLWGPEVARLIDRGNFVLLTDWRQGDPQKIAENDPSRESALKIDISDARGLVHFRRSLLEKASFELDEEGRVRLGSSSGSKRQYAVSFSDDRGAVMLAFNLDERLVGNPAPDALTAVITERTAQGIEKFFKEHLSAAHELPHLTKP
jgi:hypothetical protein